MNVEHLQLNKEEVKVLSSLIGQELIAVNYDGYSGEIVFKDTVVSLTPDEIDIPTQSKQYGDIVTLRVEEKSESSLMADYTSVPFNNCRIKAIYRIESFVESENLKLVTAHPTEVYRALLGLQFEVDNGKTFTFYTDAVGFWVLFHNGEDLPEPLLNNSERININNLT